MLWFQLKLQPIHKHLMLHMYRPVPVSGSVLRVAAVFNKTVRVYHVYCPGSRGYCNFEIGFTCRITVIFGTLKDGSLLINTLAQGRSQPHSPGWARVPLSSNFDQFFHIFPQTLLIFFLILALRVGELPTREGPGYATALASNICFSNRNMFQNGVDTLSKIVDAFWPGEVLTYLAEMCRSNGSLFYKKSLRVVEWVALIRFLFGVCHY